ncbi:MAG: 5-formyltetrahydrofolate cyclo-ligase [Alphaproteobacteria bacterium TMED87]|nr:5-formyltetrahydrofolate cyclo-ligase [Rhodospirillaceae bacterium]OUV08980.1 MAG: 5-formyltetrahydrofolate cyclo-ligase [Alphaproteobacteria bacterium TMED87]
MHKSKNNLRIEMLSKRKKYPFAFAKRDSLGLKQCILNNIEITPNTVVAGYVPIHGEIDITETLDFFSRVGAVLVLPVISKDKLEIYFRNWVFNGVLERGDFNTFQPSNKNKIINPDLILVPLLAFDKKGYRLGYGKGFYDKGIYSLKKEKDVLAFGVAYDWQEVSYVPRNKFDERLDGVFTPSRFLKIKR